MNLAFLLHLYQPSTQTESEFKKIAQDCYIPLIKLIKSKPNAKFTLNCSLSLLEQFDKYGYVDLLKSLKELGEHEKVEYTGSAAYHCLLPRVSAAMMEKQIMLNEYGLGYYLGQRNGFEGENSVMVKGIRGFFPPEMAVSTAVLKNLAELGYDWLIADETCLEEGVVSSIDYKSPSVYQASVADIKLIVRDTAISNMISFKRDAEIADVVDYLNFLQEKGTECVVVSLDAEAFGHHNPDGIYMLDNLLDSLAEMNITLDMVSEIAEACNTLPINTVLESTWSSTKGGTAEDIYPFWDAKGNKTQKELWSLMTLIDKQYPKLPIPQVPEGFENIAIWKPTELAKISPEELNNFLELDVLINKSVQSDQFWWVSGKTVYDQLLISKPMVKNSLALYKKIAENPLMSEIAENLNKRIETVESLLV